MIAHHGEVLAFAESTNARASSVDRHVGMLHYSMGWSSAAATAASDCENQQRRHQRQTEAWLP
jgi:hypothetical protein